MTKFMDKEPSQTPNNGDDEPDGPWHDDISVPDLSAAIIEIVTALRTGVGKVTSDAIVDDLVDSPDFIDRKLVRLLIHSCAIHACLASDRRCGTAAWATYVRSLESRLS
jgi:hypothetical protein